MSGSFDQKGQLDVARGLLITCTGKKRSGKSVMATLLFRSYPYDRVVIDVAGDDGPMGEGIHEITGTVDDLPTKWPEELREDGKPMTLRYVPDTGSPTYREDMDAVIGMALHHQHCCLLVHEVGLLAPANRTPPHTRRLLNANRHYHVNAIFCTPRPQTIDPLILQQSDLIYVFETQNPNDRKRIAETIGWHPGDFDQAVNDLGPHEYLRFDSNEMKPQDDEDDVRLIHFPALPEDVVASTKRWAQGAVKTTRYTEGPRRVA